MKRAKRRKFRLPTFVMFFPARFTYYNLMKSDTTDYGGPLFSGEIGTLSGFKLIETIRQHGKSRFAL